MSHDEDRGAPVTDDPDEQTVHPRSSASVREVDRYAAPALRTTLQVIAGRDSDVLEDQIREELAAVEKHQQAISDFRYRLKWGTATEHYVEGVLTWLIEQGWTPPTGVLLLDSIPADEPQEAL